MLNSIYLLFNKKQPVSIYDLMPKNNLSVTFLNPYSLYKAVPIEIYEHFSYICSDAILPVYLNKLFKVKPIIRFSFDMSSIASYIIKYAENNNKTIYFLGSGEESILGFVENINKYCPKLNIIGFHNGYISECKEKIYMEIIHKNPDLIIIGMGTPLQDITSFELRKFGYDGAIYTCGGFFHQGASNLTYYPKWVNKLNIRALYRAIKEPYVLGRIVRHWPQFIFTYTLFLIRNRRQLNK